MIDTIEGPMDEALLFKREGTIDDEDEFTTWVEYWRDWKGEDQTLMHRSAHVTLKKSPLMAAHIDLGA